MRTFEYDTITNLSDVTDNETFGENIISIKVKAYIKEFPYSNIDKIEITDFNGNLMELSSLNEYEQRALLEETEAEMKYREENDEI